MVMAVQFSCPCQCRRCGGAISLGTVLLKCNQVGGRGFCLYLSPDGGQSEIATSIRPDREELDAELEVLPRLRAKAKRDAMDEARADARQEVPT